MKLSLVPILALVAALPALALPEPVAAKIAELPGPPVEIRELQKRLDDITIVTNADSDYRTCPRTSCPVAGKYDRGTYVALECYTVDNTTVVNGDAVWVKVNEFDNCYWIPLANGETFTWVEGIPYCPKGADTGESIGL